MGARIKDLNIVSLSQANFFYFKSLQESEPSLMVPLLQQVRRKGGKERKGNRIPRDTYYLLFFFFIFSASKNMRRPFKQCLLLLWAYIIVV